jgi:hypothetical protein
MSEAKAKFELGGDEFASPYSELNPWLNLFQKELRHVRSLLPPKSTGVSSCYNLLDSLVNRDESPNQPRQDLPSQET